MWFERSSLGGDAGVALRGFELWIFGMGCRFFAWGAAFQHGLRERERRLGRKWLRVLKGPWHFPASNTLSL